MNLVLRNRNGFPSTFRTTPFHERSFDHALNSVFENFFTPATHDTSAAAHTPRVSLIETDKVFELEAELPGVLKDDIKIAVDRRRVSIDAEIRPNPARVEGESVVYSERTTGKFARTLKLPAEVDESKVEARLENGILKLTLPKKEAAQAKFIAVQ